MKSPFSGGVIWILNAASATSSCATLRCLVRLNTSPLSKNVVVDVLLSVGVFRYQKRVLPSTLKRCLRSLMR